MDHGELFQHLWNTEVVPQYNDRAEREAERRVDAFAEATLTVCGEELRMMTPRDLFVLDALENPLVSGGVPDERHCAAFIWKLHASNDGTDGFRNRFRRGRVIQRILLRPDVAMTVAEIEEYVDRMLLDSGAVDPMTKRKNEETKQERKPANTHFISPLLMNVAADIGHIDPMGGKLLGDTPLPRLLQYARDIEKMKNRGGVDENKLVDNLRMTLMERVNEIILARRNAPPTTS